MRNIEIVAVFVFIDIFIYLFVSSLYCMKLRMTAFIKWHNLLTWSTFWENGF